MLGRKNKMSFYPILTFGWSAFLNYNYTPMYSMRIMVVRHWWQMIGYELVYNGVVFVASKPV